VAVLASAAAALHKAGESAVPDHCMFDFARLSRAELEAMAASGRVVAECQRLLVAAGETVVSEALRGADVFYEWNHYPDGDVYDPKSHAQYFYHAHPLSGPPTEHGHFHTFLRPRGMPPGTRPLVMPELAIADAPAAPVGPPVPSAPRPYPAEDEAWSHLVAIAMDANGQAIRLFTTNRWVTGETWYAAPDVCAMFERFVIAQGQPPSILNRWISAIFGLFRPQMIELLHARDATVMGWRRRHRGKVHVFEDRRLEITSALDIDIDAQRGHIAAALKQVA
jgi:hypothetical protein